MQPLSMHRCCTPYPHPSESEFMMFGDRVQSSRVGLTLAVGGRVCSAQYRLDVYEFIVPGPA